MPQVKVTHISGGWGHCLWFCHKIYWLSKAQNCLPSEQIHCPNLKKIYVFSWSDSCSDTGVNMCWAFQCEVVVSLKKMVLVIPPALTAHHTPYLTSCTATCWMIMGFICRPVPVTLRVPMSAEKKPSSVINQNDCGVFFIMHCMKVLVHRIQSCFYDLCHKVCEL